MGLDNFKTEKNGQTSVNTTKRTDEDALYKDEAWLVNLISINGLIIYD